MADSEDTFVPAEPDQADLTRQMHFPSPTFAGLLQAGNKRVRVLQLVPASGFFVARPDPTGRRHAGIPVACFALIVDEQGEQEVLPVGLQAGCLDLLPPDGLHHLDEETMHQQAVRWITGAGIPAEQGALTARPLAVPVD